MRASVTVLAVFLLVGCAKPSAHELAPFRFSADGDVRVPAEVKLEPVDVTAVPGLLELKGTFGHGYEPDDIAQVRLRVLQARDLGAGELELVVPPPPRARALPFEFVIAIPDATQRPLHVVAEITFTDGRVINVSKRLWIGTEPRPGHRTVTRADGSQALGGVKR